MPEQVLTTGTFLAVFLSVSGLLSGVFLWIASGFRRTAKDIEQRLGDITGMLQPLVQTRQEIERYLREKGLEALFRPPGAGGAEDPLPPEETRRKEALLAKGRSEGLTPEEAEELRQLLLKEAWLDFAAGVISLLAFLGLVALIGAFVLSRAPQAPLTPVPARTFFTERRP